jgi:hypothetical protein
VVRVCDFFCGFFDIGFDNIDELYICAGLGVALGNRATDSTTRSRDENNFAFEIDHFSERFLRCIHSSSIALIVE